MKRISLAFAIAAFICVSISSSAQSLFEDAKGETNMFISPSAFGWARLNTSDNSVALGYNRVRLVGFDLAGKYNVFYGADAKIKVKDGLGNLLASKKFSPGFTLSGNFGGQRITDQGNNLSLYLRGQLGYNQYTYLDTLLVTSADKKKWEPALMLHFNYQINWANKAENKESYLFIGVSTGYKKTNNYEDLTEATLQTLTSSAGQNSVYTTKTGKKGTFKPYDVMPLNIDIGWLPQVFEKNLIGLNAYSRTSFFKKDNTLNLGAGIFAAQDGKPRNIIGGLAWQFNDVGDKLKSQDNLIQRSSIFVYVGFTIAAK